LNKCFASTLFLSLFIIIGLALFPSVASLTEIDNIVPEDFGYYPSDFEGIYWLDNNPEIVPTKAGWIAGWETIDISQYIPENFNATGVLLDVHNPTASNLGIYDVRAPGSTDDFYSNGIQDYKQHQDCVFVGINSSGCFESMINSLDPLTTKYYLRGFTDQTVILFTNVINISTTTYGQWVSTDVSANVSADANGVIVRFYNSLCAGNPSENITVRKPNSLDNRVRISGDYCSGHTWTVVGLNSTYCFEQYIKGLNEACITTYLVGYFTNSTFNSHTNTKLINPKDLQSSTWVERNIWQYQFGTDQQGDTSFGATRQMIGTNFTFIDNDLTGAYLTGIRFEFSQKVGYDQDIKYALYNSTLHYIDCTEEYTGINEIGLFVTLDFSSPIIIENDTTYWLVAWGENWYYRYINHTYRYNNYTFPNVRSFNENVIYTGNFPATITPSGYNNTYWAISAVYYNTTLNDPLINGAFIAGGGGGITHPRAELRSVISTDDHFGKMIGHVWDSHIWLSTKMTTEGNYSLWTTHPYLRLYLFGYTFINKQNHTVVLDQVRTTIIVYVNGEQWNDYNTTDNKNIQINNLVENSDIRITHLEPKFSGPVRIFIPLVPLSYISGVVTVTMIWITQIPKVCKQ